MKQNPFSLYDFLGYFIPGALVLYLIMIIEHLKKVNSFDITDIFECVSNPSVNQALLFIILSYVAGHFLSYISSITIEQYANWKYDYPSKYLLGLSEVGEGPGKLEGFGGFGEPVDALSHPTFLKLKKWLGTGNMEEVAFLVAGLDLEVEGWRRR